MSDNYGGSDEDIGNLDDINSERNSDDSQD
jgi:hypothetical protein